MLPTPRLTLIAMLFALFATATTTNAASYWVTLSSDRGEIAPGVNGFVLQQHGGAWNSWGSHCQAEPGSYVAGAYCRLRFNVPAGLTAGDVGNGGVARGDFRTSNASFMLRSERPGGNPASVVDSYGDGAFVHGWGALGAYVDIGLRTSAATTTTSATNWFHINTFDIVLHDPTAPVIQLVQAGSGGWNGPGCLPHVYSWADAGSQINSMSITQLATGGQVDAWAVNATGPTSGYAVATDYGCTPAPGTGTFAYRTTAVDRAGNASSYDYSIAFDTTRPTIGDATLDGDPLQDGAIIDSSQDYRPAVRWSGIGDAHSGLASVTVMMDGAPTSFERAGDTVTLAPTVNLPLGQHELRVTVIDAVGNTTTSSTMIVVRDDIAPIISVASPESTGGSSPVLDVSATDDHAGIDPTTWTVKVNGATLVASSSNQRLQANVGFLIDGTHRIVVTVADRAGNVAERVVEYRADSGDGLPDAPSLDGIFVFAAPSDVAAGTTHHVRALVVKAGRPVVGSVELRKGPLVIASGDIAANGVIDLAATISVTGPLTLHPPAGSGLPPVAIEYAFHEPAPPTEHDEGPDGDGAGTTGGGSTTTNNTTIYNPPAPAPADAPGSAHTGAFPRNVVYYVGNVPFWNGLPLGESGAPLDRVAPSFRLILIQHRAGTVRRMHRIAFRLWTTEMAVMTFTPTGSVRRTTISPRRQQRTVFVALARGSKLDRAFRAARAGALVTVRIRVVATDKNENRSFPRAMSFRVRP